MANEQKLENYKEYVESRIEVGATPMRYDQFIESLIAEVGEGDVPNEETIETFEKTDAGEDLHRVDKEDEGH